MSGGVEAGAQVILWAFAVWLIGVGVLCLIYPRTALKGLSKFASTTLINYTELVVRLIVGMAFVGAASAAAHPNVFKVIGIFLAVTAVIIMLIPRRLHAGYSVFWANCIPVWAV